MLNGHIRQHFKVEAGGGQKGVLLKLQRIGHFTSVSEHWKAHASGAPSFLFYGYFNNS